MIRALVLVFTLALASAANAASSVRFEEVMVDAGPLGRLPVGIWSPSDGPATPQALGTFTQAVATTGPVAGDHLPLIVMSHGTGGWYGGHYDTALALAHAGFVVAALSHVGDTYEDDSQAAHIERRPSQFKRVVDYMLTAWPDHDRLDPDRVGAFGFSAGGFTVLAAAGGTPDFTKIGPHVRAHPDWFEAQLLRKAGVAPETIQQPGAIERTPQIKAMVVAAPALGFTFAPNGLRNVTIPIQLWRAGRDHILPHPDYAQAVEEALPRTPEYHVEADADHFDFLAPCDDRLKTIAPPICASAPGFDRAVFHDAFNRAVVAFFLQNLAARR